MIKINQKKYEDKLYACWLGKSIGGTMGTPYEGRMEMQDISGFNSPPGNPLPNDDLDLQLLWLCLMEAHGPNNMSAQLLADHWIDGIPPYWNEYGICKTNIALGLIPPISGEYKNEAWKNSNGAWIRSEIWAGLAPFFSDVAIKYAVMDAMVDHGLGEGTYAEIFTASLESAAYYESDIKKLIKIGLEKIPATCRVRKAVELVVEEYEKGTPYQDVRNMLVEQSKDIGWFQAPANLGYVTIGLLYGEGDFKKSMIYAINCGDDTDCTGATVGAIMGIRGGTAAIPADWKEYVGDGIVSVAINGQLTPFVAHSCPELTQRVSKLMPIVMHFNGIELEYTDGEDEIEEDKFYHFNRLTADDFLDRKPYSFDITNDPSKWVRVEYDKEPQVLPGEDFKISLRLYNKRYSTTHAQIRLITGDNFTAQPYSRNVQILQCHQQPKEGTRWEAIVTAGEHIDAVNRLYVEITTPMQASPLIIPITLLG